MSHRLEFHKSSYSTQDVNCVEVAPSPETFHKSTYSGRDQNCVEVSSFPCGAAMRDSKHPDTGYLPFPSGEWSTFLITTLT